jgi:DNA polymerase-4
MPDSRQRIIMHVDMDAFYASVEQRDVPELRGKPVIVGGGGRRGVVATCSYEARVFGVRSAMPGFKAQELCPQGVFVRPRMAHYVEVSRQIMQVFEQFSPTVEPLSLDEAFLDMTGAERLFGTPLQMAERMQQAIRDAVDLPASVGLAATKFVAKIASDINKPRGIAVCPAGQEREFLAPLKIERLWGVGPKSAERLRAAGLCTIGDVAQAPADWLLRHFGRLGEHVHRLSLGLDARDVHSERERKSVGAERTFEVNVQGVQAVRARLLPLADEVASTLRRKGLQAHGVRLKIKYADFRSTTRDLHLDEPSNEARDILAGIDQLLQRVELDLPIRLAGLATFDFGEEHPVEQLDLLALTTAPYVTPTAEVAGEPARSATPVRKQGEALDRVADRFGTGALVRGAALLNGGGKANESGIKSNKPANKG